MRTYSEKAKSFLPRSGRTSSLAGPSRADRHSEQPQPAARLSAGVGHDFSRVSVTSRELPTIQPRLTVGAAGDVYEREADRAAQLVTRMPEVQAAGCSCGTPGGSKRGCADCAATPPRIQRKASAASSAANAPSSIEKVIRQPGRPLDESTRDFMESRFGHDFSQVRVHVDGSAAQSAQSIGADAYTVGRNVVFAPGRFQPASADGRRLLGHELTHVVQQGAGRVRSRSAEAPDGSSSLVNTVQRQQATAPKGDDFAPIRNDKIIYTCNCGWIDKTHATDTTSHPEVGAHNLWNRIVEENGMSLGEWYVLGYRQDALVKRTVGGPVSLLNVPSQSGSIIPGAPAISLPGINWTVDLPQIDLRLYPGIEGRYLVKRGLSIGQKKSVALAIFQEVSRAFEGFQRLGGPILGSSSGFSEEDLVSNLIGFYSAVESIPFEECLERCAPLSKADSEAVWARHGAPGSKKNEKFEPVLYPSEACPTPGVFPAIFQTIQPAQAGDLYKRISVTSTFTR